MAAAAPFPSGDPARASSYLELRHASTDHAIFVTVPPRRFIAIDGRGLASSADYLVAWRAIQSAHSILLGNLRRRHLPVPVRRTVSECLWEPTVAGDSPFDLAAGLVELSSWRWRQLIEVPASATDELVFASIEEARRNSGRARALTRTYTFVEGPVAQLLHLGGRSGLAESVLRLDQAVVDAGHESLWPLHELILADPRDVPDGRGRTIIRLPIVTASMRSIMETDLGVLGPGQIRAHPWRGHG